MNNTLSENLTRIKNATNSIRSTLNMSEGTIEDVAQGVDELADTFGDTITSGDNQNIPGFALCVKKLPKFKYVEGNSLANAFKGFTGEELDLRGLDTSNVTTLSNCFSGCSNLKKLNCSGWDTSKVTDFNSCFSAPYNEAEIDISGWDFSGNPDYALVNYLFNCNNRMDISKIIMSNCNTSANTSMKQMFRYRSFYKTILMDGCSNENVTDMSYMFDGCTSLMHLDIRDFTFSHVTTYTSMFGYSGSNYVPANCLIIVKDETEKAWMAANFSRYTNVVTAAEYEEGQK